MKKQYITWTEPVYLFHIPYLEKVTTCYDCGHEEWRWRKKGIIKIKEIPHKREKTGMDFVLEATNNLMKKRAEDWLFKENYWTGKIKAQEDLQSTETAA